MKRDPRNREIRWMVLGGLVAALLLVAITYAVCFRGVE
jgi:hypothetical protein